MQEVGGEHDLADVLVHRSQVDVALFIFCCEVHEIVQARPRHFEVLGVASNDLVVLDNFSFICQVVLLEYLFWQNWDIRVSVEKLKSELELVQWATSFGRVTLAG